MRRTLTLLGIVVLSLTVLPYLFAQNERTFTPQDLAKFNDKNGAKAYVAVNGVVYDVSNIPSWSMGKHLCPGALAGKDITPLWNSVPRSHRNPDFLKNYPVVGRLLSSVKAVPKTTGIKKPTPQPGEKTSACT